MVFNIFWLLVWCLRQAPFILLPLVCRFSYIEHNESLPPFKVHVQIYLKYSEFHVSETSLEAVIYIAENLNIKLGQPQTFVFTQKLLS